MGKGITELIENFKILHPLAYERIYEQGVKDGFMAMQGVCRFSAFTFEEDSHYRGYTYCKPKGFDCRCSFENCKLIKGGE